jgi:hypothetical protein
VDVGNGAGGAIALVFTPANALTPHTIVVNAANDAVGEGNHTGIITHTSASADPDYNGLSVPAVTVQIVDNDTPTIVINEIDADQTGTDMMEFVELYDGGVGNVSLNGLIVVFFNGAGDVSYQTIDLAGRTTDANGFFVIGNASVPGVDLTFANDTLQNGADAVALYAAAASAFPNGTAVTTTNLRDAIVYDTNDADDAGLLVLLEAGQPQVNENQNGTATTQSLSRVPDNGTPRQTTTYVTRNPTPGALNQVQSPGVLIVHSGSRVDIAEGGVTDSYQIALQSLPTADVMITVDPDVQTNLGAGAGVAIVLTFTTANGLIPQMVNVTATDDLAVEGVHTSLITHTATSADSAYNGIAIGNVVANIVDNDAPPVTSIVISEIMYNPASDESAPGVGEWIEVVNTGAAAVDLGGWLFDDEDSLNWGAIPMGTVLNPNQRAVFFDTAFTSAATFRAEWSVPTSALVVGITWASLANTPSATNEILELLDTNDMTMDVVNFDDVSPWPSGTVNGPSIYLTNLALDNNNGANWARSVVGVADAVSPSGGTFNTSDVGSPGRGFLAGDYNRNNAVDAADYVLWRKTLGMTSLLLADGSGPTPGVPNGVVDQPDYDYWSANFGTTSESGGGSETGGGGTEGGGVATPVSDDNSFIYDVSAASLDATRDSGGGDKSFATVDEPPLVVSSQSIPTASADELPADTSAIRLVFIESPFKPAVSDKYVLSDRALGATTFADGLLSILEHDSAASQDEADVIEVRQDADDDYLSEIDDCFELFEEYGIRAGIEWSCGNS